MFFVRLSKNLNDKLSLLSSKTNRTKGYHVTKALTKFLEEQEKIEWATQAYKEYLESGIPFNKSCGKRDSSFMQNPPSKTYENLTGNLRHSHSFETKGAEA